MAGMAWRRQGNREARTVFIIVMLGLLAWLICIAWQEQQRVRNRGTPPSTASATIRIATWNLRKFSERTGAGQHPPDLVEIASIIKAAKFDLIAIQEVQREGQ